MPDEALYRTRTGRVLTRADIDALADEAERGYFHCPRCGKWSANPTDKAEGYCGHCHDWTGLDQDQNASQDTRAEESGDDAIGGHLVVTEDHETHDEQHDDTGDGDNPQE